MTTCTTDLRTHVWRPVLRLALGLVDVDGFGEVFLVWTCCRCALCVWADGVVHSSTPPMTPPEWAAHAATGHDPWQGQVDTIRREARQAAAVRARIAQATRGAPRGA